MPKIINKIDKRLASDLAGLPKTNKTYLTKEYTERVDSLKSDLNKGAFLMDKHWDAWFKGILEEIERGNPVIPKQDITLLLGRYRAPNAHSVGEGTIVFNISLLPHLKNESQVAFVLCHELAHYVNDHGNLAIQRYVNTLYSPETQAQLKTIVKGKYNKTEKALALMKSLAYNGSRHGRFKESEADSLGFVFLSHTRYCPEEAVGALQLLDSIDVVRWPQIPYATWFNAPEFPFQAKWLDPPPATGLSALATADADDHDVEDDSLKTHPDCPARVLKTQKQLEQLGAHPAGTAFMQDSTVFAQLQEATRYEILEGLYQRKQYGYALFKSLVLLTNRPEDAYLNTMVIKSLYGIGMAQRNHRLRKVLDLPNSGYSNEYNRYLRFINQFRLADLGRMTYYYYYNRREKYSDEEEFAYAAVLAGHLSNMPEALDQCRKAYLLKYPLGKHVGEINKLEK